MSAQQFWRRRRLANVLLLPPALCFAGIAAARRLLYRIGVWRVWRAGAPVVVVGNIVAGGGGKTPLVIALTRALRARGANPGVVSRGYGGDVVAPRMVTDNDDWRRCGDEALLIRRKTGAPVCTARKRAAAARALADAGCDIILSDDGLQHYAMHRDMEIAAVNCSYRFGNGWPLPAGPLREGRRRLAACDAVVHVGMSPAADAVIEAQGLYALSAPARFLTAADAAGKKIAAIAGIAHPPAFFSALAECGFRPAQTLALPDHGHLPPRELNKIKADIICMSEKDAVKYPQDDERLHALAVSCRPPDALVAKVAALIKR